MPLRKAITHGYEVVKPRDRRLKPNAMVYHYRFRAMAPFTITRIEHPRQVSVGSFRLTYHRGPSKKTECQRIHVIDVDGVAMNFDLGIHKLYMKINK